MGAKFYQLKIREAELTANNDEPCVVSCALYVDLRKHDHDASKSYKIWVKLNSDYAARQHKFIPQLITKKHWIRRMSYRVIGDVEIYVEQQHVNVCLQSHTTVEESRFYKISINFDSTRVVKQYKSVLATLLLMSEFNEFK